MAAAMKILESPLMGAFISYMLANWNRRSRVDQSRRRLRNLVVMVRAMANDDAEVRAGGAAAAVRDETFYTWLRLLGAEALRGQEVLDAAGNAAAVAGSARRFLGGLRDLFAGSDEIDRLEEAFEELQRQLLMAPPGAALDRLWLSVFAQRQRGAARATDMDVNGGAPAAGARLPVLGSKRKRACTSGVDPGSTSRGVVDTGARQKRRVQPRARHPAGFGGRVVAATREPAEDRARTVALAMERVRRRIGTPTRRRRQAILGQHFSRFSLQ
ncbi:hypothetical protein HU200_031124 [Digitaria exilis]|uniref:Uncharacterized protein n=1 Tax=Digitaria exilis TaxID=1010633 RepID=A0A835BYZ4_9POAL|nr:hypothetical protein HU200_031124 [Digitaria exilis]CAB3476149.1 unnamed protein product [Digitaria exilis]